MIRALCILALAGCAQVPQLPPCSSIQMTILQTSSGYLYAFDRAQIAGLTNMIQQVQDGKCRIVKEEKES